jgi:hypothetical protein
MMAPTHLATGLAVAAGVATVAPDLATAATVGGLLGGAIPDVDLFVGRHRRTLHYPVYGWVPAAVGGVLALAVPTAVTVGVAVGSVVLAVHASSDVLGAADELRPWERTADEAVYAHALGRWLRPRYVVRYDGAPEDLLVAGVLTVPVLFVFDGPVGILAVANLLLGGVYVLVRKRTVRYVERFAG